MQKDISVVIPLYNKEKYIQRTLDSVLNQTFQNFECIIIDSSTDPSTDQVNRCSDPRIIHITCAKSTAANARNLGVQRAQSDFIAFLDADDEWEPDHLETLLNIRKKFPDAGLFSTPHIKLKQNGSPKVMLFVGIPKPPWEGYLSNYLRICSRGDEPVHSSSCAVPRDIFNSMGGFPDNLVYGEDQYLWGKISLSYPMAYSWKGLAIYHTEAMDRICNKEHAVKEHPFSQYLKQELAAGTIPLKKRQECRAYIRRKWYSEFFSSFIMGFSRSCDRDPLRTGTSTQSANVLSRIFTGCGCVIRPLRRAADSAYHSTVHDWIRSLLCKIYGSYNPGFTFSPTTSSQKAVDKNSQQFKGR